MNMIARPVEPDAIHGRRGGSKKRATLMSLLVAVAGFGLLTGCEPNPNKRAPDRPEQAGASAPRLPAGPISLLGFARMLAETDEAILAQRLEVAIAQQSALATAGAFEPEFYTSLTRSGEYSQTNASDYLSRGSSKDGDDPTAFEQYTSEARMGLELRDRQGISLDLYYEMSKVKNSLQEPAQLPSPEHSASVGLSLEVPLLRGGGRMVNTSNEVVTGIDERIAVETTRQIKAQRAYEGLTTYLMVQRAQARVRWRQKIASLAKELEREMAAQVEQGLRSQSDLIEAQSERAVRASDLALARQELSERLGAFQIYFTGGVSAPDGQYRPADPLRTVPSRYLSRGNFGTVSQAFSRRPEARINGLRVEREEVLRLVAANQALPEANLVGDFRKTRLSEHYIPFRDVFTAGNPYETWRIGFEFRRGLRGDLRGKADLEAAKLREKQAELAMNAFRNRIASELNGIGSILVRAQERLSQQNRIVQAQKDLLRAEETSLQNGASSQVNVIVRQIELAQAQELRVEALVQLNLASYLASQVDGTLLERLGVN